jgi:hypothetical protein
MGPVRAAAAAFVWACVALVPAAAAAVPVDLELVLAVDVSFSIDEEEAQQQRDGYVRALTDPDVVRAIGQGALGRIAVAYVEWAGQAFQRVVVDWRLIDGPASARDFAETLARQRIASAPYTAIGDLIDYAAHSIRDNGFEGTRKVIDISGDGPSSSGRPVWLARDDAVAQGLVINGVPIINNRPNPTGGWQSPWLDYHYANKVIGGPGAFLMVAEGFEDFAQTILRKLIREVAAAPGASRAPARM